LHSLTTMDNARHNRDAFRMDDKRQRRAKEVWSASNNGAIFRIQMMAIITRTRLQADFLKPNTNKKEQVQSGNVAHTECEDRAFVGKETVTVTMTTGREDIVALRHGI
jgi:hypothetical protein